MNFRERFKTSFINKTTKTGTGQGPVEAEPEANFALWLENQAIFEAQPEFRSTLKEKLHLQLATRQFSAPPIPFSSRLSLFRLLPSAVAVLALLFVASLALLTGLNNYHPLSPTPVAVLPAQTIETVQLKGFTSVFDPATQDYVNLAGISQTIGFSPRLPEYIPESFNLANASITYGPPSFGHPGQNFSEANQNQLVGPEPHGLQFQLITGQDQPENSLQVFQLKTPLENGKGNPSPFMLQGPAGLASRTIQGTPGFYVSGEHWQISFAGTFFNRGARQPNPTPQPGQTRPSFPPNRGNNPNPLLPPAAFMELVRVAFRPGGGPNGRFLIDFEAQTGGKPAHSLVWQNDGVLLVLVGNATINQAELQRIAESFKPVPTS